MPHHVFFILDAEFVGDLWELSRLAHVWLIKSPLNEAAARTVWDRETKDFSPLHGVTLFDGSEDNAKSFYAFLSTIDMHHDEYSAPRPWDTLHVIGLPIDVINPDWVAEQLETNVVMETSESEGFIIKRVTNNDLQPVSGLVDSPTEEIS